MATVVKSVGYNRVVKDVQRSPEDIFQREVYRSILHYASQEQFEKRQRLNLIKELYSKIQAHKWIHREFIKPCIIDRSTGNDL